MELILTKNNYKSFLFYFNKMMERTGCLELQSSYSKKLKGILKSGIHNITKTNPSFYFKNEVYTYRAESGLRVNFATDSTIEFRWGTKFSINSEKITYKSKSKSGNHFRNSTIKPCTRIAYARMIIQRDEKYTKQYWADVAADWEKEKAANTVK